VSDLDVEVAVIGAGLMGAATAWELSRRNRSVALVEAYAPGHVHGSSHGTSRIVRRGYEDPFYIRLTGRAFDLWRDAEVDTGVTLIRPTGGIDHGAGRDLSAMSSFLSDAGVAHDLLSAAEAEARWPGMRFDRDVLFHPQAGVLDADATVTAWVRRTAERAGHVVDHTRVESITPAPSGMLVHTEGPTITAGVVVVAAGAWLPELAGKLDIAPDLPALSVTQQQVFHFRHRDATAVWPTFVYKQDLQVYGLESGGDGGAFPAYKVAEHDRGTPTTASTRTGLVDPSSRQRIIGYVTDHLPGLDPEPVAEATCLYTTTPNDDFILDRVGQLVIVSPCSGHGAKFAPLIGSMAADLALGLSAPDPRFRLATSV
jgi:monomeric sarcosine oxidase